MPSLQPFTIDVPAQKVDRLRQKLSLIDFPDELEEAGWDLGCPLKDIKRLAKTWEQWDWRKAQEKLNSYPQFHADIEIHGFGNLDIHFLHQTSELKGAIPLLFVHGCESQFSQVEDELFLHILLNSVVKILRDILGPGSFIEVLKILPILTQTDGKGPSFHVVAPSLPNFGFSQGVSRRGFALVQYAETCHKLMLQLGYNEYVTQAGDWGFWITRTIGKLFPENCKANHINMIYANPPSFRKSPWLALQHSLLPYSVSEKKGLVRTDWFHNESRGYNFLQSTKPQTVTYALQDSPIALLSWIYEKLHDWSDEYPWTDDEILTWVSIYAFSRAGPGAAHRIYYEVMHDTAFPYQNSIEYTPNVKLGLTYNPKDLDIVLRTWGRTLGDVVFETENERGGYVLLSPLTRRDFWMANDAEYVCFRHFYAHECPELLARDVKTMFGKGGGAYGIVAGKDGYDSSEGAHS